jgi:hypothetical protein
VRVPAAELLPDDSVNAARRFASPTLFRSSSAQAPIGETRARDEPPSGSPLDASPPECLIQKAVRVPDSVNLLLEAGPPGIDAEPEKQNPAGEQARGRDSKDDGPQSHCQNQRPSPVGPEMPARTASGGLTKGHDCAGRPNCHPSGWPGASGFGAGSCIVSARWQPYRVALQDRHAASQDLPGAKP